MLVFPLSNSPSEISSWPSNLPVLLLIVVHHRYQTQIHLISIQNVPNVCSLKCLSFFLFGSTLARTEKPFLMPNSLIRLFGG